MYSQSQMKKIPFWERDATFYDWWPHYNCFMNGNQIQLLWPS